MSGYAESNAPAFREATAKLRADGHEVFSPEENDRELFGDDIHQVSKSEAEARGLSYRSVLKVDLQWICEHAEACYFLPGWERSAGANAEHRTAIALMAEGMRIVYL